MQSKGSSIENSSLEILRRGSAGENLLRQLRAAIGAQFRFWDVTRKIAETLRCEPQLVRDCATEVAITIDNPTDVGERELDEFLTAALGGWVNKGSLPY